MELIIRCFNHRDAFMSRDGKPAISSRNEPQRDFANLNQVREITPIKTFLSISVPNRF